MSKFIGTWSGNMETSIFGLGGIRLFGNLTDTLENNSNKNFTTFRVNGTAANITKLEFTSDKLYMTITMGNKTQIISQTYTVKGNKLVLSHPFNDEQPPGESPFNESERPFFEGENPFDSKPPFNESERLPFDRGNHTRTRLYTYYFDDEYKILFFDGSPFIKVI